MADEHKIVINELIKLLNGGGAHTGLDEALNGLPEDLRGAKPGKLPYSIWQLVEHLRIAQWDMLEFSKHEAHLSPKWPDGYWVSETAPADEAEWGKSVKQINDDREEFIGLLRSENIYKTIPHGEGQTILREAMQIADHNAYHVAEIIVIRRLLGSWQAP